MDWKWAGQLAGDGERQEQGEGVRRVEAEEGQEEEMRRVEAEVEDEPRVRRQASRLGLIRKTRGLTAMSRTALGQNVLEVAGEVERVLKIFASERKARKSERPRT